MTAEEIAARFAHRAVAYAPGMRDELRRLGEKLLARSLFHMEADIYARPVPTSKGGRPKWKQSGRLKAEESLVSIEGGNTVVLTNAAPYAEPRHEMGKPGRRQTDRPAHWRDEAVRDIENSFAETLHARQVRILREG